MKVVVTGGSGYVGFHVGWAIAQGGHKVVLVDLVRPDPEWNTTAPKVLFDALQKGFWEKEGKIAGSLQDVGSLQYCKANITSYDCLRSIFAGATAVIHTASYGISGQEQLSAHMTQQEEVNVIGTRTVLMAATDAKVQALVYTSTYNVVFGGQEVRNGDESLPIFPLHAQSDHYSRTKTIADMMVLMANGKSLHLEDSISNLDESLNPIPIPLSSFDPSSTSSINEDDSVQGASLSPSVSQAGGSCEVPTRATTLRTCTLRLAGVMGLAERRHSRRVIDALRSGFLCTFGRKENLVDFVGIQNVVQAHIKAMMALINEQSNDLALHKETTETNGEIFLPVQEENTDVSNGTRTSNKRRETPSKALDSPPQQVSGNAFFISDRSPKNHFEYFRPWYEGLGYGFPAVALPLVLIMIVAHIQQITYSMIHRVFPFKPFITPAEVYKSGVTHYFSIQKAERCFDYKPTRPNDQSQIVEYYKGKGYVKGAHDSSGLRGILIVVVLVFSLLFIYFVTV